MDTNNYSLGTVRFKKKFYSISFGRPVDPAWDDRTLHFPEDQAADTDRAFQNFQDGAGENLSDDIIPNQRF